MQKLFKLFFLFCIFTTNAYSIEYIQKYKSHTYNKNFDLNQILLDQNCTKLDLQKKIFNSRYPKPRIGQIVKVQTCYQDETFSDDQLKIIEWEKIKVKRNFILSIELEKNNCKKIYTQQIPHFYLKNKKKPQDVNVIKKNQKIYLQKCFNDKNENVSNTVVIDNSENETVLTNTQSFDEFAVSGTMSNKKNSEIGISYRNKKLEFNGLVRSKNVDLNIGFGYGEAVRPHILFGFENNTLKQSTQLYIMPGIIFSTKKMDFYINTQIEKTINMRYEIDYELFNDVKISIYNKEIDNLGRLFGLGLKFLF